MVMQVPRLTQRSRGLRLKHNENNYSIYRLVSIWAPILND